MTETPDQTLTAYPYRVAGKTWVIPVVYAEKSSTGHIVFSESETARMNAYVANLICNDRSSLALLTGSQLGFLCDVTGAKLEDAGKAVGVGKGVVAKWKKDFDAQIPSNMSTALKNWFSGRV